MMIDVMMIDDSSELTGDQYSSWDKPSSQDEWTDNNDEQTREREERKESGERGDLESTSWVAELPWAYYQGWVGTRGRPWACSHGRPSLLPWGNQHHPLLQLH